MKNGAGCIEISLSLHAVLVGLAELLQMAGHRNHVTVCGRSVSCVGVSYCFRCLGLIIRVPTTLLYLLKDLVCGWFGVSLGV